MYRTAFFVGKFLLYDMDDRLNSFIKWIKGAKDSGCAIRMVYDDRLYDFEVENKKNGRWQKVGNLCMRALKEEMK